MRKVILIFALASNMFAACVYSLGMVDGFGVSMSTIDQNINLLNNQAKAKYSSIKDNQAKNILKEFKNKKKLLQKVKNLSEEDDYIKYEILHELEKKSELKSLLIDTWSTQ